MKDTIMKKSSPKHPAREMRDEYDFSGGVRGQYVFRNARGTNSAAVISAREANQRERRIYIQ